MTEGPRSFPVPSPEAAVAWQLVQVTETLRAAETSNDDALRVLRDIDTRLPADARVTKTAEMIARLQGALADFGQLVERAVALTESLPADDIDVDYDDLAGAAAHDLADGIFDPARARWAAELLDHRIGWRALAEGLRSSDAQGAWGSLTVQDLLATFRGTGSANVNELTTASDTTPDTAFAECSPPQIALLAASLDLAVVNE